MELNGNVGNRGRSKRHHCREHQPSCARTAIGNGPAMTGRAAVLSDGIHRGHCERIAVLFRRRTRTESVRERARAISPQLTIACDDSNQMIGALPNPGATLAISAISRSAAHCSRLESAVSPLAVASGGSPHWRDSGYRTARVRRRDSDRSCPQIGESSPSLSEGLRDFPCRSAAAAAGNRDDQESV